MSHIRSWFEVAGLHKSILCNNWITGWQVMQKRIAWSDKPTDNFWNSQGVLVTLRRFLVFLLHITSSCCLTHKFSDQFCHSCQQNAMITSLLLKKTTRNTFNHLSGLSVAQMFGGERSLWLFCYMSSKLRLKLWEPPPYNLRWGQEGRDTTSWSGSDCFPWGTSCLCRFSLIHWGTSAHINDGTHSQILARTFLAPKRMHVARHLLSTLKMQKQHTGAQR